MPKPLTASEIEVRLGATWINAEYIEQFMKDVLHTPQRLFSREWVAVKFAPINCEWNIKGKNADSYNPLSQAHTEPAELMLIRYLKIR